MAAEINTTSDDRIGGYRYVRTIHPGATSVVMEVLQEGTQRRFALKQLLASRAEDREEYRAFIHEAKLGMELRHRNLIRVYEFVKDPVQPYFVMELFTGHHLKMPIARPSIYPMPRTLAPPNHRASRIGAGVHARQGMGAPRREAREHLVQQIGRSAADRLCAGPAGCATGLLKMFEGKIPRQGTKTYMCSRTDPLRVARAGGRYLQLRNHLL